MKKHLSILLLLLLAVLSRIAEATPPQFNNLTSCQLSSNLNSLTSTCADVPPPNVPIPSLYDGTSNTKHHGSFGADYFRITLPSGITDKTVTQLFPDYSKAPAWNSDGSIIILKGTQNGHIHLLNGNTYEYIRELMNITDIWYYQYPEPRWSHTDPDVFYYVSGMKFNSYRISNHVTTTIRTFTDQDFGGSNLTYISNGDEGNPDDTDRYWVFMGMDSGYVNNGILVYDRQDNVILSHKNYLAGGMCGAGACPSTANWVGMSHSGNHVIVNWNLEGDDGDFTTRGTGTESFNRSLTYLVKPSEQNNHMDVATLSNGTDVLVGRSHMTDNNAAHAMRAVNLNNGSVVTSCMLPVENGWHVSGRTTSSLLKGWVLLSIWDQNAGGLGTGIFASESIALNMDTCEVRRIAHTQSYVSVSNYNAYPFSSMNWDFTKIIWRSNWRNSSNPVQTYIVELTVGTKALSPPSNIIITP